MLIFILLKKWPSSESYPRIDAVPFPTEESAYTVESCIKPSLVQKTFFIKDKSVTLSPSMQSFRQYVLFDTLSSFTVIDPPITVFSS